ncbi:ROK family protein [Niameybacter massiliensis]|uniref:ROK family protein n=1 Tax=Niameybacter massiliensis TaxID=1658108 RepID=UPI0006B56537|nr:ROK family protein [Niameybacter massiliensis]
MSNYVGVDIGCTKMYFCAVVDNHYIEKRALTGLDCPKERIKEELEAFLKELPFIPEGIGMAIPGLVKGDYMVELSDMSDLTGVTVDYFSEGRFPIRFINDVKAATVCEISNHPDSDTLAVIMAGSGLAIGVYSKGKMITGAHGFAGELGYCVIQTEDGPTVLDDVSGGMGILRLAQCDAPTLLSRLENNDPSATALIAKAGHYFGLALTNIIHLFNPDTIVIGGSTSTYTGYLEHALSTASQYTLKDMYTACTITTPKDLKRIVALGALEYIKSGLIL